MAALAEASREKRSKNDVEVNVRVGGGLALLGLHDLVAFPIGQVAHLKWAGKGREIVKPARRR